MSNSDYSRLLTKMAELRELTSEYTRLTTTYTPAITNIATTAITTSNYTLALDKNAISKTSTPLVTRPGEDFGRDWKYVGKVTPGTSNTKEQNSLLCWNLAANDTRLFKKVVYTGDNAFGSNPGQPEWNNRCYGLIYDASANSSFDSTVSAGYTTMVGRTGSAATNIYTKLGIGSVSDTTNVAGASKLQDIQRRVNSLVKEIVEVSKAGINTDLNKLVSNAKESNELISQIHRYMNEGVDDIDSNYDLMDKQKNMGSVYAEINEQRSLLARKYRFIFYIVIAISIIIGFASYTSKLSIIEQIDSLKNLFGFEWWTSWWVITTVIVIFILASFGWEMKGNIMMVVRYVTDPAFWTGQMWWVGVSFLLLLIIFFHATFKSFFVEFDTEMKNVQEGLDNES
jgi:hypothetical protein